MPDITMCRLKTCHLKNTCYRYMVTPSYRQTYFLDSPYKSGECEFFWPLKKESEYEKGNNNDREWHNRGN
jgi:hypothetical protein